MALNTLPEKYLSQKKSNILPEKYHPFNIYVYRYLYSLYIRFASIS